jgi:hypothetical protein
MEPRAWMAKTVLLFALCLASATAPPGADAAGISNPSPLASPSAPRSIVSLQTVYDGAGPADGYDKFLILDPANTYTGGLWIHFGVKCCIRGDGAEINLQHSGVRVQDAGSLLDIDHCIVRNGQMGLQYLNNASGTVRNNTVVENDYGIVSQGASTQMRIENNIVTGNAVYGLYWQEYVEPVVQYNTVWDNAGGDYMHACG